MKKIQAILLTLLLLPTALTAQVTRQVEVTKSYIPTLEQATKLAVQPDMTDTVTLRPEIDYTITPLAIETSLQTRPIRPAKVTYWTFNRPMRNYLKVGAGYPFNSLVDLYTATQNPGTGYLVGWVNHRGFFNKLQNIHEVKQQAKEIENSLGAAAGKYLGRHTLEGMLTWDHRQLHHYGADFDDEWIAEKHPIYGSSARYHDLNLNVRIGDEFLDLSRTNFEVALRGGLFFDRSGGYENDFGKASQHTLGGSARVARAYGRHYFDLAADYDYAAGSGALKDEFEHTSNLGHLRALYGRRGDRLHLEAGINCYFSDKASLIFPHVKLGFDLGNSRFSPFFELDSEMGPRDYRTLTYENPFIDHALWPEEHTRRYTMRLGFNGVAQSKRFEYSIVAALDIYRDYNYWGFVQWYLPEQDALLTDIKMGKTAYPGYFETEQASFARLSAKASLTYRPTETLRFDLSGALYHNDSEAMSWQSEMTDGKHGLPNWEAALGMHYENRKISFGIRAAVEGKRTWSIVSRPVLYAVAMHPVDDLIRPMVIDPTDPDWRLLVPNPYPIDALTNGVIADKAHVDLSVDFAWRMSDRFTLFVEGTNLLNSRSYRFAGYRARGLCCTAGLQFAF